MFHPINYCTVLAYVNCWHSQADDAYAFLSEDVWSRRKSLRITKVKLTNTKEISGYIQRAGNNDKALLKVILETDSAKFPEARVSESMHNIIISLIV